MYGRYVRRMEDSRLDAYDKLAKYAITKGIGAEDLKAFFHVESNSTFFWATPGGQAVPPMRFEAHKFADQLNKDGVTIEDLNKARRENLVASNWREAAKYAIGGVREYSRLEKARQINSPAAERASSWAAGQVMGFHAEAFGYTIDEFIELTRTCEGQVQLFIDFLEMSGINKLLANGKYHESLRRYNGSAYKTHGYDKKFFAAKALFETQLLDVGKSVLRGPNVKHVQILLGGLRVDGVWGRRSTDKLISFQMDCGLVSTGYVDSETEKALLHSPIPEAPIKPLVKSKETWSAGTTIVAGTGGVAVTASQMFGEVKDILETQTEGLTAFGIDPNFIMMGVTICVVATGAINLFRRIQANREGLR